MNCETIIFLLLIFVVIIYGHKMFSKRRMSENFNVDSQNFVYNNKFEEADSLQYGGKEPSGMYQKPVAPIFDASSDFGVNQNSGNDIFDVRGYNNTRPIDTFGDVNAFVDAVDENQLRNKFERTYMLDPSGVVGQYDISNMPYSPKCCPATYGNDFMGDDDCDYANKYVANNYSGMNYGTRDEKGRLNSYGCLCMTPKDARFYGSRGGNAV